MKNELLICKYCGGSLVHKSGSLWICEYCDKTTFLSDESGAITPEKPATVVSDQKEDSKFVLKIQLKKEIYQLTMADKCVITATYKKRTTMADKFPMTLEISVGDDSKLIDPFENVGKGVLTLNREGNAINVVTEGKIKVDLKGTVGHDRLSIGSSVVLGSLSISIAELV